MKPSIGTSFVLNTPSSSLDAQAIADKYGLTLGLTPLNALLSEPKKDLGNGPQVPGDVIKIIIELHPNGGCVHKENEVIVDYHLIEL
jgi:hypothetical protein